MKKNNDITLSKDNKFGSTDNGSKRDVTINRSVLEYELKAYFKWRTVKGYNSMIDRFFGLGSSDYDSFINHLIKKGY